MVSIILWPYFRFAVFAALNCENRCIPIALLDLSKDKFKDAYILAHLSTVFFFSHPVTVLFSCYCLLCGNVIGVMGERKKTSKAFLPTMLCVCGGGIMADTEQSMLT